MSGPGSHGEDGRPSRPSRRGLSWRNLTPYLAADQACCAFQVADYAFNQKTLAFLQRHSG